MPANARGAATIGHLTALLALALSLASPVRAQAPQRVRYPAAESATDARQAYPRRVLELALARSGAAFAIEASTVPANQQRALRLLAAGDGIDVVWSVATDARERKLRAIPFAIDRGMFGWRVLLVRRGDAARFADVHDIAGLSRLTGAQGADWPDLRILRSAGLRVDAAPTYDGLFAMLERKRIDYLPRSVLEVGDELAGPAGSALEIEPHLLLRYPAALYFYVNRDNDTLALALERGLAIAQADGSLEQLFQATYGDALAPLALATRTMLAMPNPTWTSAHPEEH